MLVVDDRALLLETDNPAAITGTVPRSRAVAGPDGAPQVAVYWGWEEARALAQLGWLDTPSPLLRDYKWPGKLPPFEHQKETSSFLSLRDKAFCFNQAGTGKTASVIWAADYLMQLGQIRRVLVLCPLSIMKSAWQQDLFKFAMHRSCGIAYGTAKQRKKVIADGADFVILNSDGLGIVKDEVLAGGFDLVVADEATSWKSAQTNRWKILRDVARHIPKLWMLTGTPAAQSPLDAYGLAKLVNPAGCPQYFGQFRDMTMLKLTQFKWTPKPHAEEVVHRVLQPAIRFEKKDCLDLPPVLYIDRDAPLTAQQREYYNKLRTQLSIEAAGEKISAVNAAARMNKLLQVSGGAAYSDTGETVEFDVSNRLNVVLEAIEEASHKVLVFVPYTHTIQLLDDFLRRQGVTTAVIDGSVNPNKRADIVKRFQEETDPHVLILQPAAASHGLTLTAADTTIWYSPVTSVETYLQANARFDRTGQHNAMTVIHIRGSEMETRLYGMLRGNIAGHERIIDLYRQEMEA